jgi:hypothetical protein
VNEPLEVTKARMEDELNFNSVCRYFVPCWLFVDIHGNEVADAMYDRRNSPIQGTMCLERSCDEAVR